MKGFTPRERNGLIALGMVVALCLSLGWIADHLPGCTRTRTASTVAEGSGYAAPDHDASGPAGSDYRQDSVSSRESRRARVSGRDSTKMDRRKEKSGKKKGRKRKDKMQQKRIGSQRRSLRDEPVN